MCPMNREIPIGKAAKKLVSRFSTAVIRTVRHRIVVPNISRKRPQVLEQDRPRELVNRTGPGVMAEAAPPAAIPAMICENHMTTHLVGEMALASARDRDTAGFKAPPDTPAKHQTENMTENPKPMAIMISWDGCDVVGVFSEFFKSRAWLATLQMT